MKTFAKPLMLLLTTAIAFNAHAAGKVSLESGDLSVLKGEKTVNIEFTYDNMSVGKFDKEADYVKDKTEKYNSKEAGKGDTWAKAWVTDRESRFQPKFIEMFEKYSEMSVSSKKEAKYTLIFHTTSTEPGYHTGVSFGNKNAEVTGEVLLVETANPKKIIAKMSIEDLQGRSMGYGDFDTGARLSECYELGGKVFGKFVKSEAK